MFDQAQLCSPSMKDTENSEVRMTEIISPFRNNSPQKEWSINPIKVQRVTDEEESPAIIVLGPAFNDDKDEDNESSFHESPQGSPCESPVKNPAFFSRNSIEISPGKLKTHMTAV